MSELRIDSLLIDVGEPPSGEAGREVGGRVYVALWLKAVSGGFELWGKDKNEVNYRLSSALDASNFVVQDGDATLDQLTANGLRLAFLPPVRELEENDVLLALRGNDGLGQYGLKGLNPSLLSVFTAVAAPAATANEPGKPGYIHVNQTKGEVDLWVPKFGGGTRVIRFQNVVTNFNLPTDLPSAPVLSAKPGVGQVDLAWTQPGEASVAYYEIYSDIGLGLGYVVPFPPAPGALRTFADTRALPPNGTIKYRMRAFNASGGSALSNEATVTLSALPVFVSLQLVPPAGDTALKLRITYALPNDPSGWTYRLERSADVTPRVFSVVAAALVPDGSSNGFHDDTGLVASTHYVYRTRAEKGGTLTDWSAELRVQTAAAAPVCQTPVTPYLLWIEPGTNFFEEGYEVRPYTGQVKLGFDQALFGEEIVEGNRGDWAILERKPGLPSAGGTWAEVAVRPRGEVEFSSQNPNSYFRDTPPSAGFYSYRARARCGSSTYSAYSVGIAVAQFTPANAGTGNDAVSFSYEAPLAYGANYDPSAKFGTFAAPGGSASKVRFINEAGLHGLRKVWHRDDFKATAVGHHSLYSGEYAPGDIQPPPPFEQACNFANENGVNGFMQGFGIFVGGNPDNPQNGTPEVLDQIASRIPLTVDVRVDVEFAEPTPAQWGNLAFRQAYINTFGTGLLRRMRARGQRGFFYGGDLYKLNFSALSQAGFKLTDTLGNLQARCFGGRNPHWSDADAEGKTMFDLSEYPYAADLQVIDAFYCCFRFANGAAGGQNPIATNLIRAAAAATGANSTETIPTRFRVERLPGACGDGSTSFRFTLEDEAGNKVVNWNADAFIPQTMKDPHSNAQLPLDRRVWANVNFNNFQTGDPARQYREDNAQVAFTPGSATAEVCIKNTNSGAQPATPLSSLDLQTEMDAGLITAYNQIECNHLFHPTCTPYVNTAPTPHSSNEHGWVGTGNYPGGWFMPRLVSLVFNLQGAIWQWGIGSTNVSNRPIGMGQDEATAMLKRVKGRERFIGEGVKRPDFALKWPVSGGSWAWTKRRESVPPGGDLSRYDGFWVMDKSIGTFGDNTEFSDLDAGRKALVNPVPLVTVAQKGREVLIEGHVVGRVASGASNTYEIRVRDADNASNEKTFSITMTGKETTRIVGSMD